MTLFYEHCFLITHAVMFRGSHVTVLEILFLYCEARGNKTEIVLNRGSKKICDDAPALDYEHIPQGTEIEVGYCSSRYNLPEKDITR